MKRYFCLRDCICNGIYFQGKQFYTEDDLHGPPNKHFKLVVPAAVDDPEVKRVIKEMKNELKEIEKDPNPHPAIKRQADEIKEKLKTLTQQRRRGRPPKEANTEA